MNYFDNKKKDELFKIMSDADHQYYFRTGGEIDFRDLHEDENRNSPEEKYCPANELFAKWIAENPEFFPTGYMKIVGSFRKNWNRDDYTSQRRSSLVKISKWGYYPMEKMFVMCGIDALGESVYHLIGSGSFYDFAWEFIDEGFFYEVLRVQNVTKEDNLDLLIRKMDSGMTVGQYPISSERIKPHWDKLIIKYKKSKNPEKMLRKIVREVENQEMVLGFPRFSMRKATNNFKKDEKGYEIWRPETDLAEVAILMLRELHGIDRVSLWKKRPGRKGKPDAWDLRGDRKDEWLQAAIKSDWISRTLKEAISGQYI